LDVRGYLKVFFFHFSKIFETSSNNKIQLVVFLFFFAKRITLIIINPFVCLASQQDFRLKRNNCLLNWFCCNSELVASRFGGLKPTTIFHCRYNSPFSAHLQSATHFPHFRFISFLQSFCFLVIAKKCLNWTWTWNAVCVFGWILQREKEFEVHLHTEWEQLIISLFSFERVCVCVCVCVCFWERVRKRDSTFPHHVLERVGYSIRGTCLMWSLIMLSFG
jgi:hypothetical protein